MTTMQLGVILPLRRTLMERYSSAVWDLTLIHWTLPNTVARPLKSLSQQIPELLGTLRRPLLLQCMVPRILRLTNLGSLRIGEQIPDIGIMSTPAGQNSTG